jgi:hypothetical protein
MVIFDLRPATFARAIKILLPAGVTLMAKPGSEKSKIVRSRPGPRDPTNASVNFGMTAYSAVGSLGTPFWSI